MGSFAKPKPRPGPRPGDLSDGFLPSCCCWFCCFLPAPAAPLREGVAAGEGSREEEAVLLLLLLSRGGRGVVMAVAGGDGGEEGARLLEGDDAGSSAGGAAAIGFRAALFAGPTGGLPTPPVPTADSVFSSAVVVVMADVTAFVVALRAAGSKAGAVCRSWTLVVVDLAGD